MLKIFDGIRDLSFWAVLIRLVLATFLGAVIGLERSAKNRPAGFRTHILVCLGSAVAAMTGLFLFLRLELPTDVTRLSSQVISGLGFIVAGTIVVTKTLNIKGLTTAAGLWTTGIVGIAIGSGYYEAGILTAVLILLTETLMDKVSAHIRKSPEFGIEVLYTEKDALDNVLRMLKDHRLSIINLKIHSLDDEETARYSAIVELRGNAKIPVILEKAQDISGIVSVSAR